MKYNGCFRDFAVLSALQVHIEALAEKSTKHNLAVESAAVSTVRNTGSFV